MGKETKTPLPSFLTDKSFSLELSKEQS